MIRTKNGKVWKDFVCHDHQLMASTCGCLDQSKYCRACESEYVRYLGSMECLCTIEGDNEKFKPNKARNVQSCVP